MQSKFFYNGFKVFFKDRFDIFVTKSNKFFLIFSSKSSFNFVEVPLFVRVKKWEGYIFFNVVTKDFKTILRFANFHKEVSYLLKALNKKFKKHLVVKGLGMRIKYFRLLHKLQLKLGYSNLIVLDVPMSIQIYKNKDVLVIEGNNSTTVGNFANLVRSLKIPDNYKGKGVWYKNELRVLKPVKKV